MSTPINTTPAATTVSINWLALQTRVLISGVLVIAATVTFAVWGPAMDIPGMRDDARTWAAGATLLGGLLLLTLHGLMLRPLGRLNRRAAVAVAQTRAAAEPASSGHTDVDTAVQRLLQERAAAERTNSRLHSQLRALIEAMPHGVALSQDRRFEISNAAFCETMGWSRGELHGRSPYEVFSSVNRDDSLGAALREAFSQGRSYEADLDFRRRDGQCFRARLHCRQVESGDVAAGTLWFLRAAQTSVQPPAEAQVDAQLDTLTGLLTAEAFSSRLCVWLQGGAPARPGSLLIIDLDRFKTINDAAGRAAGDTVLRQAAAVLQSQVREGDAVARLEGDTYAMLLPGCVAPVALQMGERLRTALGQLGVDHAGRHLGVGATVGVAELDPATPMGMAGADAWLAQARAAWYEAKYAGQGGVRLAAGLAVRSARGSAAGSVADSINVQTVVPA
jgi:diguanylate cyclase (GGDEF)-like protein/PAS domain S-box-containing protein